MEAAAAGLGRSANGGVVVDANREADDVKVVQIIKHKSEELVSKDDQIESTNAEMGEVQQENQRLRMHLDKISKEYQTLQMQFQDIMFRQEAAKRNANNNLATTAATIIATSSLSSQQPDFQEHDVSLSLGRTSSCNIKKEMVVVKNSSNDNREIADQGLALGLDCSKFEASKLTDHTSSTEPLTVTSAEDNSFDEEKKEDVVGETWQPPKVFKRSSGDDEIDSYQNNGKRARVSVRARCDTPTMNDGCQWRKYGQKIAKGNPCPRAYYRCTIAPSCPVRKQVQRCPEDMSVLITTYEGTHSHPLPAAATAMASTTSAAASMLVTGSSTSSKPASTSTSSATTSSVGLHGLTFNPSTGGMTSSNPRPHQFYIQNSSQISPSPNTHPTITLDLTTSNPFASPFVTNPHFNRIASSTSYDPSRLFSSKSTSLNFASMDNNPPQSSISWAPNQHSVLNYGNMYPQSNNRNNHNLGSLTLASRQPQENLYQSLMQKNNPNLHQQQQQPIPLPDTIAAATKAITTDPSFQTALAAALTSIIGGASGGPNNNNIGKAPVSGMENLSQKMKWPHDHQISTLQKGSGCGSTFLTSSSGTNAQSSGQLMFPQSSTTAASKSKSTSPTETKDYSTD